MNDNFSDLITRIEDLPYKKSPPMQLIFSQKADISVGTYPFTAGRATVTGEKNINDQTLLYVRSISFSADIPLIDYQKALKLAAGTVDIPNFQMFLQSDSNAPLFQDPIDLLDYFNDKSYRLIIEPKLSPNTLTGFFRGTLQQHAGLAGVTEINLNIEMIVQQITDDAFIHGLDQPYPYIKRTAR